jgi:hypothetical protein
LAQIPNIRSDPTEARPHGLGVLLVQIADDGLAIRSDQDALKKPFNWSRR